MKKLLFMLCASALMGIFSSCHSASSDTMKFSPVVIDQSRLLVVTVNTPSNITYDGKTVNNVTFATFKRASAKGNLMIKAVSDEYYDQEDMPIDFYNKLLLAVNVKLVKKPTILVSQADALNGVVVTNDKENQESTHITAMLSVKPGTIISGNTTDPFTITTYFPAETILESTNENDSVEANVLGIRCTPDGAVFSEPVSVTLTIPNSTGFDIVCRFSGDETEEVPMEDLRNDKWLVMLSHFSDWYDYLQAVVIAVVPNQEISTGTMMVKAGLNVVPFKVKSGAVETSDTQCDLVTVFLEKKYGVYYETTRDASFTSNADGMVNYRIVQSYYDVTLQSNERVFTARVYDDAIFEILNGQGTDEGHSGGLGY